MVRNSESSASGRERFIDALRTACNDVGGQNAWARLHGFSPAYVSDVLNGRRDISERFASALGWEAVMTYRPRECAEVRR